jgi:hypothetical protein
LIARALAQYFKGKHYEAIPEDDLEDEDDELFLD